MMNFQPTTSDLISIGALGVAVLIGVANFIYTRRTFEASTYPSLKVSLHTSLEEIHFPFRPKGSPQSFKTCLYVALTNLSTSVSIAETQSSIKVANPFRGWRFWQKWLIYSSRKGQIIEPTLRDRINFDGSIEEWLAENLPSLIRKVEPQKQYYYYSPSKLLPLELLLEVRYWPGVSSAGFRDVTKFYKLMPSSESIQGLTEPGCNWVIEEAGK
jgi:hypothetical protein